MRRRTDSGFLVSGVYAERGGAVHGDAVRGDSVS